MGNRGINFIVMIVLARLLTPKIFGLIGMLLIFIQVSQVLVIGGFNQALIQKKNTDEEDYSSVFWINLVVSVLIYIVLFFSAPLISYFYQQPILTKLLRAFSLVFVINAFSYVQEARLQKEMRFKTLAIIHVPSTVLGGVVSVVMAVEGYGVWSIIALQLVTRFAFAVQIWFYAKWKPLFTINKEKARSLFSYGSKLMFSQLINTVFRNAYLVSIGKFFSLASTGYYQNSFNLVQYPASTITNTFQKVIFPAYSTVQDNNKRLKAGHKKLIQQTLFWICPAFILAGVLAKPLFRFVFTAKWLPAVPYFQMLCVVGIFWPINVYGLNIINVKGRSDITLKLEIVKKSIIAVSIVVAIQFGVYAVIIAQVVNMFIAYFLNSYFCGKYIYYSLWQQIKDILPILILSAGVGVIVLFIDHSISSLADIVRIVIGLIIGVILYWLIAKYVRLQPYLEISRIVHEKLLK